MKLLATLVACAAVALVLVASASGSVRKVTFTGVVSPNDYATLTVSVSPRARCTIKVVYDLLRRLLGSRRLECRYRPTLSADEPTFHRHVSLVPVFAPSPFAFEGIREQLAELAPP